MAGMDGRPTDQPTAEALYEQRPLGAAKCSSDERTFYGQNGLSAECRAQTGRWIACGLSLVCWFV
jgi:hypothetical protein